MFQNLKVDIVYYKTNTDFEMEFNLCGCCRMRLLTDKAPDQKIMLHDLARAVSRSKIIIIVGSLFGEDSIIKTVSRAIDRPLSIADNAAFGIVSNDEIEILDSATPLVTSEGYFGGCIIESGPQTMILLSDNKNVRKSVMQSLIHPYIIELCADELKEAATVIEEPAEPETEEAEEIAEVEEEITEEPEPEIELSGTMTYETDDEIIEAEPQNDEPTDMPEITIGNFADDFSLQELSPSPRKEGRKPLSLNLPILILTVLLLITIAVVVYCLFYIPSKSGVAPSAYIRETFNALFS